MKKIFKVSVMMFVVILVLTLSSCKKTYEVTFKDYDDTILKIEKVKKGGKATAPEASTLEGYSFVGWDKSFTKVKSNLVIKPIYDKNMYTITFETFGASYYTEFEMYYDESLSYFDNPNKSMHKFLGWFFDEELKEPLNLERMPARDLKLYAKWGLVEEATVTFNPRIDGVEDVVFETTTFNKIHEPFLDHPNFEKEGYVFKGWYTSKKGPYYNDPKPESFPLTVTKDAIYYAYFEPIDFKNFDYDTNSTYVSTLDKDDDLLINPISYEWIYEGELIDMLSTPLFKKEVNWDKAIKEGLADFYGDFSKFNNNLYSIDQLDYMYELIGAVKYPVNENGESAILKGEYSKELTFGVDGRVWTFEIRDDLMFDDGTLIDAYTFEFTLKQWLDSNQKTTDAEMWFKNVKILKSFEYYMGTASWEDVGFKVDPNNKYKFTITLTEMIRLFEAMEMVNKLKLVNPNKYLASFDSDLNKYMYGTKEHPYSSYGGYVIKQWDEEKITFNKNYNYIAKHLINFKSHVILFVDEEEANDLFLNEQINELELTSENYFNYVDYENIKEQYQNIPLNLIINQADSKLAGGNVHPTIMADKRFRQALLYGLDRVTFTQTVFGPHQPTLLPITHNTKNYLYDAIRYTESDQHINLIENELGLELDDYGYNPSLAVDLFNAAYSDWLEEGNTGPVKLKYITDDSDFSMKIDNYIKEAYEELFKDESDNKRLIIDVNVLTPTNRQRAAQYHDFDLALSGLSLNTDLEAYWHYIAIALIPGEIGASQFGISYPYIGNESEQILASYMDEEIIVDFNKTYAYLSSLDEEEMYVGFKRFLELLDENGTYSGTVKDIVIYMLNAEVTPFDSGRDELFEGASNELYNLIVAFEKVFLDYVPIVPIASHKNVTAYKNNVVILWPDYSKELGFGSDRYRYLNTDPDFIND